MATTANKSASAKKTSKASPPAKKSAPAKTSAPAKKSTPGPDASSSQSQKKSPVTEIARAAARQLTELTGAEPEGVTGLERTDHGWTVYVEVLELRRVPNSTDLLAVYAVEVDTDGDLTGYHRVRRYVRGQPDEE